MATKKKTCTAPSKTKKFNGKTYTRGGVVDTKSKANKQKKSHKAGGKNKGARVVKNPCGKGYYVYKRG